MPLSPSRRSLLLTAPLAALAATAACGSEASSTAPDTTGAAGTTTGDAFPVEVEHALGTTTVEAAPERIATWGWGSQDVVWALGLQPVGMPETTYGGDESGAYPWWEGYYDPSVTTSIGASETGEVPFEKIAELTPDLVLAVNSGLTEQDWTTLTQIAPTVAYPEQPWQTSWQDQATLIGRAVGKAEEAERLVAEAEADLADRAAANPQLEGKSFAYVYATAAGLSVYLPGDSRVDTLHGLGLVDAPGVTALAESSEAFYVEVAKERVRDLDCDVLVGYGEISLEELTADPVYATMPAVANGAVVWLTDENLIAATSTTLLNLPWQMDRLVPELAAAADAAQA
ncbi:iron-siderophore ABC transporter substrate-binding protein [Kineococcus arenarius]|uniref:iron-siderophore ABC transporter substrate-binding protein n=1 Tax=Kineococcus sp. SYSU DK007 TaxID=3383128 RepID=UPI003D7E00C4